MVMDHWSNDAMVSMDRCGLVMIIFLLQGWMGTSWRFNLSLDSIAVSVFVFILVEFDKSETSRLVYSDQNMYSLCTLNSVDCTQLAVAWS